MDPRNDFDAVRWVFRIAEEEGRGGSTSLLISRGWVILCISNTYPLGSRDFDSASE